MEATMAIIPLDPEHNNTTECFKRQSRVFFSDQFLMEPKAETIWKSKATKWLIAYLTALLLAFLLLPMQSVKATAPVIPVSPPHKQLLPNFQKHLSAFQACTESGIPIWLDKTTIQCLKEIP